MLAASLAFSFLLSAHAQPPPQPPPPPMPPGGQVATTPATKRRAAPEARDAPRKMMFLAGGGVAFGGFYPQDVNAYIELWQDTRGDIVIEESGFSAMVLNLSPRVALTFAPIEYVQVQAIAEIGWGPKFLAVSNTGDSELFNLRRYSLGGTVNGHVPLRAYRNSLFAGGGVLYHWMGFEEYRSSTLGYRGQVGFRFYKRRFAPEVFLAFDWARTDTGQPLQLEDGATDPDRPASDTMELSFNSVLVGANMQFAVTQR